ncbi:MAG: hypothetical protein IH586_16885 [Anaerolineaceae bacterium]|nr:hypothetical protein [Anaerolineaceae bacterium]
MTRYADSIWIFDPGEAKWELEKHLLRGQLNGHVIGIEPVEKMADHRIALNVRQHYQKAISQ